MPTHHHN